MALNFKNYNPALMYGATIDITLSASNIDTETGLDMSDADSLTTGKIANFTSNSSDTGTRTLVQITNDNTLATGATALTIQQDAAQNSVTIDHNGATGVALNIDGEQTTAVVVDISAAVLTQGKVIDISDLDAITTGKAIHIDATGVTQTDGILVHIDSASTALTSTGRLLLVDHTGVSAVSNINSEFKSAAADETIIVKVNAAGALTGVALDLSATTLQTGKVIDISDLDAITTGKAIHVDATGVTHTDGILVHLDSAGTAISSTGRILLSDHTGVTTTSGILNEFKTAANDETILVRLTAASLTTGTVLDFGTTAALTTGVGLKIAHTTSVIADGGSLVRISSSSIDTGGATNGTLLDIGSTAQVAGVLVKVLSIATTGTVMDITSTGIMTTTGNLLTLTANSATTAAGLVRINANGLTDGIGAIIASSATAMTATGRLFKTNHTGATSASGAGILNEFASAATDATTIVKVTASAALAAGKMVDIVGAAVTTGTLLNLDTADALTTGTAINVNSDSADTGTRSLVKIINDNTASTGTTNLEIQQDADLAAIKITGVTTTGIDFTALGNTDRIFNATAATGSTAAPQTNAPTGFIKIAVGGTDQWVPYYNAT